MTFNLNKIQAVDKALQLGANAIYVSYLGTHGTLVPVVVTGHLVSPVEGAENIRFELSSYKVAKANIENILP